MTVAVDALALAHRVGVIKIDAEVAGRAVPVATTGQWIVARLTSPGAPRTERYGAATRN